MLAMMMMMTVVAEAEAVLESVPVAGRSQREQADKVTTASR